MWRARCRCDPQERRPIGCRAIATTTEGMRVLVLHGFWSPERGLGLWAEDSERTVTSRSQALRSTRPHPFAVSVEVLAKTHHGKPGTATLRLPSLAKSPLDSPELIRVAPRGVARSEPVL